MGQGERNAHTSIRNRLKSLTLEVHVPSSLEVTEGYEKIID